MIGATSAGFTILLKSARLYPLVAKVTMTDAIRNPITNFGNRRQISAGSALRPATVSHRVVAMIASTKAHTPIQTSRPTTFISVKAQIV